MTRTEVSVREAISRRRYGSDINTEILGFVSFFLALLKMRTSDRVGSKLLNKAKQSKAK